MVNFYIHEGELADRDVEAMRGSVSPRLFYIVTQTKDAASSGYDPIYGEAFEPFTSGSMITSAQYVPFQGSVLSTNRRSEMFEQGFHSKDTLYVDVCHDCIGLRWQAGTLILSEGKLYRITDVDERGLDDVNRIILTMDQVT